MTIDYNKRVIEETEKFCKKHKLQFEDVADLIGWISWIRKEQAVKDFLKTDEGQVYQDYNKIREQAVRKVFDDVKFWINDWWAEGKPLGVKGLIKKINKLKEKYEK